MYFRLLLAVSFLSASLALRADNAPQALPFAQVWSNPADISANDSWTGVVGIEGFRGDGLAAANAVDPQTILVADSPGVLDVNANQTNPATFNTGGVTEFDLTDDVLALAGSGTARAPYLKLYLDTTGQSAVRLQYNLRDVDGSTDNSVQPVALQFRVGNSGNFINVPAGFVADASTGPNLAVAVTAVDATLPAAADNQALVEVRIMTTDAAGNDEWIGIDDINVTGTPVGPPDIVITDIALNEGNAGTTNFVFTASIPVAIAQNCDFSIGTFGGTATEGVDYVAINAQSLSIPAGSLSTTFTVLVNGDTTVEADETIGIDVFGEPFACNIPQTLNPTATIVNDDSLTPIPVVSINNQSGLESATPMSFTVSLDVAATQASSVLVTTSDGTATTADNDYSAVTQTVNFAVGQLSQTVTVPIINDSKVEANESFSVTLSAPSNLTLGTSIGTGTINNDDSAVVSVGSNTLAEGNGPGTTNMPFTVSLTNPVDAAVSVSFATSNGTAIAPGDFTATAQSVSFTAGQVSQTVNVPIVGDVVVEPTESFNVAISALNAGALAANVSLGTASGTGTISNDDAAIPVVSISGQSGVESASPMSFTVSLDVAATLASSVLVSTSNGTATTADNDYSAVSQTVNFAVGQLSQTVTVPIINDSKVEANESFSVTLSAPNNLTLGTSIGTGTINNDDSAVVSVGSNTLAEGNGPGTTNMPFTVSLTNPVDAAVSVSFATSNGTAIAPGDFTATTQSVNFVAGQVSQTVNVPIVGDVVVEPSESFNVAISALNAGVLAGNVSLGTASGTGTINNDDAAIPVVSISGQSGLESATPMSFTVSLDVVATQASSVLVSTSNGTATTADNDYSAVSQTVNFAVGQLSQTVTVPIINDSKVEANESFSVTLSAPNNLTLGTSIGTGTINNDDSAVVSVGSNTLAEGNGPGTTNMPFTVSLTNPVDAAVSVSFATSNGTAIAPGDYTATTQSVSFAAGQVSQTVNVPIVGDVVAEPNESFNVAISALNAGALAGNVSLGTAAGTGTINNDDSATVGLVGNVSVVEGNAGLSNAQFTVSLSAASNSAITVNYATADGTATLADNDYQAQSGSLTFAPGTTSLTINVPVIGDTRFEPNETFLVNLSAANGATLGLASATATISNDDVFATLAVPTLRSTALILLGVMLGVLGIFAVARQQR